MIEIDINVKLLINAVMKWCVIGLFVKHSRLQEVMPRLDADISSYLCWYVIAIYVALYALKDV